MKYCWFDYTSEYESVIDSWLDSDAAYYTGFDEGFESYYMYWANESQTKIGENFWVKLFSIKNQPIGLIVSSLNDNKLYIAEYLISPLFRGKGIGKVVLLEFLEHSKEIIGTEIKNAEAVIYPSNTRSQKVFEHAGFTFNAVSPEGDVWYYSWERC